MRQPARLLILLTIAASILVWPGSASALHPVPYPDNYYSWSDCSWNRYVGSNIRVSMSGLNPFPGDSTAPDNGAPQSFRRRTDDMTARWSTLNTGSIVPKGLVRVADGALSEVNIRYVDPANGTLATVFIRRTIDSSVGDFNRCSLRGTSKHNLRQAEVRVMPRSDWFTQDDPYRAAWEACGSNFTGYTCSKRYDFGRVIGHELGHTLGLRHPEESATNLGCPGETDAGEPRQPTMCQITALHRSEGRSLEGWDNDTLHVHVNRNR